VTDSLSRQAHAKANLFLRVLSREGDGYHGIETLFCRLELADTLTAQRTAGHEVTLEVEGGDTGPVGENLAVRALRFGGSWATGRARLSRRVSWFFARYLNVRRFQ